MGAGTIRQRHVLFKRPIWVVLALVLLAVVAPAVGSPAAEEVVPLAPLIAPQGITFHVVVGQPNPPPQPVRLSSQGDPLLWTAEFDAPWLALDLLQGLTPAEVRLRVDAGGFAPGRYETTLRIEPGAALPVTLDVYAPSEAPAVAVGPAALTFEAGAGAILPKPQTVTIRALDTAAEQAWSAVTSAPWLTLSAYSGVAPAELVVSVDHNSLPPGEHAGMVWVGGQTVNVLLQIAEPPNLTSELVLPEAAFPTPAPLPDSSPAGRELPVQAGGLLSLTPLALRFAGAQSGVAPEGKDLEIAAADGSAQTWTATADVPWLALSSTAGTTPAVIKVGIGANQLAPGVHTATIIVNEQPVTVRVVVLARIEPAPAFLSLVARHDEPVRTTQVGRTWLWGPQPLGTVSEPYAEAPGGQRVVQYYDKARLEITQPGADPASGWYVTNGRLAWEMITGRIQVGDTAYDYTGPSVIPVAGDADDLLGPTYASFAELLAVAPAAPGSVIIQSLTRDGGVRTNELLAGYGVTAAYIEPVTDHAVASVFWDYLQSRGPVWQGGALVDAQLFEPWHFVTGLPITEAYWARVKVGGAMQDVLIQCFERRCLTYAPGNIPQWQVEQGNVGLHYFRWRYE